MPAKPADESYDQFYRNGGWRYDLGEEILFLHFRVLQPLGLVRGRALELGCGQGVQTEALRFLLGEAHGVDTSVVAIEQARERYPIPSFTPGEAQDVLERAEQWDLVFARGMSWFHYELESETPRYPLDRLMTSAMARLAPSGHFVLQIRTDFSGRIDPSGIRHHTVSQLASWARRFGTLRMMTDWMGLPLQTDQDGMGSGRNAIVAIQVPLANQLGLPPGLP